LWQVACEFIAASRKLREQGFTEIDAWQSLAGLMRLFPLVLPNSQMLTRARVLHVDHRCSFWDAMLLSACLEGGVTRLYTQDVPSRPPMGLDIINPFA
jgi:predicted nucleic acid-binding protein